MKVIIVKLLIWLMPPSSYERQQLYQVSKAEFESLQSRTSALETTVGKMGLYVHRLGTGDVYSD
jgi:hypothetical protein